MSKFCLNPNLSGRVVLLLSWKLELLVKEFVVKHKDMLFKNTSEMLEFGKYSFSACLGEPVLILLLFSSFYYQRKSLNDLFSRLGKDWTSTIRMQWTSKSRSRRSRKGSPRIPTRTISFLNPTRHVWFLCKAFSIMPKAKVPYGQF